MLFDPVLQRLRRRAPQQKQAQALNVPTRIARFASGLLGDSIWGRFDYDARLEQGFRRNPIVHRCVRMIAESCAGIPIGVYKEDTVQAHHPLAALLHTPNPMQSGTEILESLYSYLLLHGNAYIEVVGETEAMGLYALRPDRMRLIPSSTGWAQFYDYTVNDKTTRFDQAKTPTPILHFRLFHPQDDHYGLSPMEAAGMAINIHNAANSWNKSLFDNAARPSGALVYRGQDGNAHLSDEQFTRLKQELETNFQGAQNAGRPLLLEGGLDWSSISLSPQDMDFIAAKHSAARDIALAFGVPPMLLGIPGDNTYANYAEANRAFWRQTVLPLAHRIIGQLQHHLCNPNDADPTSLKLLLDAIPALSEERQRLWQRLDNASFLTRDEKRIAVGYPPLGEDTQ